MSFLRSAAEENYMADVFFPGYINLIIFQKLALFYKKTNKDDEFSEEIVYQYTIRIRVVKQKIIN